MDSVRQKLIWAAFGRIREFRNYKKLQTSCLLFRIKLQWFQVGKEFPFPYRLRDLCSAFIIQRSNYSKDKLPLSPPQISFLQEVPTEKMMQISFCVKAEKKVVYCIKCFSKL